VTENLADQIIKRAITRIQEGWTQWEQTDRSNNNVCLTQALNEAASQIEAEMPPMPVYEVQQGRTQLQPAPVQALAQANQRVTQAAKALYPGQTYAADSMIAFNDHHNTTKSDVVNVLQHALVSGKN
jgi:hypothetical protein